RDRGAGGYRVRRRRHQPGRRRWPGPDHRPGGDLVDAGRHLGPRADECPEKTEPVAHGYAHTPQCAVVAAMTGQTLLATTGDTDWPDMANTVLAPGAGKDQWVQSRALMSVEGRVKDPAT